MHEVSHSNKHVTAHANFTFKFYIFVAKTAGGVPRSNKHLLKNFVL